MYETSTCSQPRAVAAQPHRPAWDWPWWAPLLVALVVGLAFQGSRGLQETSETRYAECAREMLVTGNWMEPTLEFLPHWTKPPVAYWCIAAGMKAFGANAWGARLPGALAFVVATGAVLVAARRLRGPRAGLAAGLVFGVGFLPAAGAHVVTTDIYLTAAEALAGAAFIFAAMAASPVRRRWWAAGMGAAFGLGFMIKGPPALLPLLAFVPWNLMQPKARRVPLAGVGLLAFCAVALPWYGAMIARHPELLHYYVGTEIIARVSTDLGHNRAWYKAFSEYGPALVLGLGLPGVWVWRLVARAGAWRRAAYWRELWSARGDRLLLLGWLVLPLLVFAVSRSKLTLYVLPLMVPMAILVGAVLAERASWRRFRNVVIGSLVCVVAAKAALPFYTTRQNMAALGEAITAVRAELPQPVPVVLWNEPNNHGVNFYLGATPATLCERIAVGEKARFEEWTPVEWHLRYEAGAYPDGALLVVSRRKVQTELFRELLSGLPVRESVHSTARWRLLLLAPPAHGESALSAKAAGS